MFILSLLLLLPDIDLAFVLTNVYEAANSSPMTSTPSASGRASNFFAAGTEKSPESRTMPGELYDPDEDGGGGDLTSMAGEISWKERDDRL